MNAPLSVSLAAASPTGLRAGRLANFARGLALPLGLLVLWQLSVWLHWVNPLLVAAPERVLSRALEELREGELLEQLFASLRRDLYGCALGSAAGLVVGVAMGASSWVDRGLGPTFHAAKQVAIFAWIPLLSVWFGTGELAKVVFVALAAFYPLVLNAYAGVRGVPREYVEVARVFRFTRWQLLRRVVLPAAAPSIFAGLQLALVYAWLGTLGAEYLLAPGRGIGNLMIDGREQLAMDKVLLGVVIAGALGAALNSGAGWLERRALRWRRS